MEENNKSNFKLNLINMRDISQILQYLSGRDWVNLLVTCKPWNKAILPAMWEHMTPMNYYPNPRQTRKSYMKYGHYIRHLEFNSLITLPSKKLFYPNATDLVSNLSYYLRNWYNFDGLLLNGLIYETSVDDLTMEEYIFINEIYYESIFANLDYLNVLHVDNFFKNKIIPILPPTLRYLELNHSSGHGILILKLLDKLESLKHLLIKNINFSPEEFKSFTRKKFPYLRKLNIEYTYFPEHTELELDFNLLPKLNKFQQTNYMTLKFTGVSNLTQIILRSIDLNSTCFNINQFPNLNFLELSYCNNLLTKHIYSILKLPKLAHLEITSYNSFLLLLEDVYPNQCNSLISLKLVGFTLNHSFLNYFYKFCWKTERLELRNNLFDFDFLPLKTYKNNSIKHKLETVIVDNSSNCPGLKNMVETILEAFLNIKIMYLPGVAYLSQNIINKYYCILKLYQY